VFIGLDFPRYLTDTVTLAGSRGRKACGVIALTDRPSSPMAPLADVALYAQTETRYRPNCETSVLALIEALTSAVALAPAGNPRPTLSRPVMERTVVPSRHAARKPIRRGPERRAHKKEDTMSTTPVIAIHGGAGTIAPWRPTPPGPAYREALSASWPPLRPMLLKVRRRSTPSASRSSCWKTARSSTPATARSSRTTKRTNSTPP
jgi:hypothetical protein